MDYEALYKSKLNTAEEAAKTVRSGDWVDYGWCVNTPVAFDAALAGRMNDLTDVKFRGGILMWEPEIFKIENPAEHLAYGGDRAESGSEGIFLLCADPLFRASQILPGSAVSFPGSCFSGVADGFPRLLQFRPERIPSGSLLRARPSHYRGSQ